MISYIEAIFHPNILFQDQEAQYDLLLSLQTELLSFIKDGVTTRNVYQRALNFIKEKNPDLEKHFVKNVGFSVRPSRQSPSLPCSYRADWN